MATQKMFVSYYGSKSIPKDAYLVQISNSRPKGFRVDARHSATFPDYDSMVVARRNEEIDDAGYTERYMTQIIEPNREKILGSIPYIMSRAGDRDIYFLCHEQPGKFCHRYLLGNFLIENRFEVREPMGDRMQYGSGAVMLADMPFWFRDLPLDEKKEALSGFVNIEKYDRLDDEVLEKSMMEDFGGLSPEDQERAMRIHEAYRRTREAGVLFEESEGDYAQRTIENAAGADVTLAFARDFNTAGERLTRRVAGGRYVGIQLPLYENMGLDLSEGTIEEVASHIYYSLEKITPYALPPEGRRYGQPITVNLAGNGICTLKDYGISQEQLDEFLCRVAAKLDQYGIKVKMCRSGGQTGVDQSAVAVGVMLDAPVLIHAPKGYVFRDIEGKTQAREDLFKGRFVNVDRAYVHKFREKMAVTRPTIRQVTAESQGWWDGLSQDEKFDLITKVVRNGVVMDADGLAVKPFSESAVSVLSTAVSRLELSRSEGLGAYNEDTARREFDEAFRTLTPDQKTFLMEYDAFLGVRNDWWGSLTPDSKAQVLSEAALSALETVKDTVWQLDDGAVAKMQNAIRDYSEAAGTEREEAAAQALEGLFDQLTPEQQGFLARNVQAGQDRADWWQSLAPADKVEAVGAAIEEGVIERMEARGAFTIEAVGYLTDVVERFGKGEAGEDDLDKAFDGLRYDQQWEVMYPGQTRVEEKNQVFRESNVDDMPASIAGETGQQSVANLIDETTSRLASEGELFSTHVPVVTEFTKETRFLSNFARCKVMFEGHTYPSVENAYQAAKCKNEEERMKFLDADSPEAKRLGKTAVALRDDWEDVKDKIMTELVRDKFNRNPRLGAKLDATGMAELREGNKWGDRYWGVDIETGQGENKLGKILMQVRSEIRRQDKVSRMIEVALDGTRDRDRQGARLYYDGDGRPSILTIPTSVRFKADALSGKKDEYLNGARMYDVRTGQILNMYGEKTIGNETHKVPNDVNPVLIEMLSRDLLAMKGVSAEKYGMVLSCANQAINHIKAVENEEKEWYAMPKTELFSSLNDLYGKFKSVYENAGWTFCSEKEWEWTSGKLADHISDWYGKLRDGEDSLKNIAVNEAAWTKVDNPAVGAVDVAIFGNVFNRSAKNDGYGDNTLRVNLSQDNDGENVRQAVGNFLMRYCPMTAEVGVMKSGAYRNEATGAYEQKSFKEAGILGEKLNSWFDNSPMSPFVRYGTVQIVSTPSKVDVMCSDGPAAEYDASFSIVAKAPVFPRLNVTVHDKTYAFLMAEQKNEGKEFFGPKPKIEKEERWQLVEATADDGEENRGKFNYRDKFGALLFPDRWLDEAKPFKDGEAECMIGGIRATIDEDGGARLNLSVVVEDGEVRGIVQEEGVTGDLFASQEEQDNPEDKPIRI